MIKSMAKSNIGRLKQAAGITSLIFGLLPILVFLVFTIK